MAILLHDQRYYPKTKPPKWVRVGIQYGPSEKKYDPLAQFRSYGDAELWALEVLKRPAMQEVYAIVIH